MHSELTQREQDVLDYIQKSQQTHGITPTVREIGEHLNLKSPRTVSKHLEGLREKGILVNDSSQARSFRIVSPLKSLRKPVVDIPVLGSIPAGTADDRTEEIEGCVTVDIDSIGVKVTARTKAIRVKGDSMIGKHILDGDIAILEFGKEPKPGDVVAAYVDRKTTLKTLVFERGKPRLRAENPKYKDILPAEELVIQGVMVGLIRKSR